MVATQQRYAARRGLLLTFAIGTGVKVLLVAAIAAILKHALRPVVETSSAVRKLGQGKLDTRIAVRGKMNCLCWGLISIWWQRTSDATTDHHDRSWERTQLFTDIILRMRRYLNLEDILKTAVKVRKSTQNKSVVIYRFDPDWNGTVVAESVTPGWTQALGKK